MINSRNGVGFVCVFVVAGVLPGRASAQDIGGRFQLSAQANLVSGYYRAVPGPQGGGYGVGVGGAAVVDSLGVVGGVGPVVGVGLGYALDEHWVPGIGFRIAHADSSTLTNSRGSTTWSISPGLRYVFARGQKVRPFFGGALSFGRSNSLGDATVLGGNVILGTQLHLVERVSFDPFVQLAYAYQHQPGVRSANVQVSRYTAHTVNLVGGFALSLWL